MVGTIGSHGAGGSDTDAALSLLRLIADGKAEEAQGLVAAHHKAAEAARQEQAEARSAKAESVAAAEVATAARDEAKRQSDALKAEHAMVSGLQAERERTLIQREADVCAREVTVKDREDALTFVTARLRKIGQEVMAAVGDD